MNDRHSLRTRIVAAYVLLACAVCGAFAAGVVYVIGTIEDRLIDERLERTADRLVERLHQGRGMDLPPSVSFYRGADIPAPLRGKPPGRCAISWKRVLTEKMRTWGGVFSVIRSVLRAQPETGCQCRPVRDWVQSLPRPPRFCRWRDVRRRLDNPRS